MEEETVAVSEVAVVKTEEMNSYVDPNEVKARDLENIRKKEDDESNLDGEFIKVEESVGDVKSCSSNSSTNSSPRRKLHEARDKVKELEYELVAVSGALRNSESEITRLNDEVSGKEELEESGRKYDELEITKSKLSIQVSEAEGKYDVQRNTLQDALQDQETRKKEMNDVKEAYDNINLELKISKKKRLEVEHELQISEGEAKKFEELHRQSGSLAELEKKKALEFERLLEMAKVSAIEVENQMATLQEQLLGLYEKIAENEKLEEALRACNCQLSDVEVELEFSKSRVVELEERLELKDAIVNKVAQLESEFSSSSARITELELQLKSATEKENVLNESLNMTTEEKINLADALNKTTEKLVEAENSLHVTHNELNLTRQRLEIIESDLKAAGMREFEVLEKLKLAEEQLEKHCELELELQEVIANFNSRDYEVQALEDQVMIYKEQTTEAAERSASLKEEFDEVTLKLANSESTIEELKKRVSQAENQAAQSLSEIDMLVETNTQLKTKINELQESLTSEHAEKERTSQKLSSHLTTIMELSEQLSNSSEHTESHNIELEQSQTKLKDLESVVEQLHTRSSHFEKECEGLAGVNFNLTQELAEHESELNILQTRLSATLSDKNEAIEQLHASQKAIEDLKLQCISDAQRLQSQISSVMEEYNLLAESNKIAKEELQTEVAQLEEQIEEHKSNEHALKTEIEILKAAADKKSVLYDRVRKSEEQLALAEAQLKEEHKANSQQMETDANKKIVILEKQVKELKRKLQLTGAETTETVTGSSPAKLNIEMKSRNIGSSITTSMKTTGDSSTVNLKFALVLALVSVIIGLILGKRY